MDDTKDAGREPEPATTYDSDMAAASGRKPNQDDLQANIELMKRWATERPLKVHP
jgi:hypothetical protein